MPFRVFLAVLLASCVLGFAGTAAVLLGGKWGRYRSRIQWAILETPENLRTVDRILSNAGIRSISESSAVVLFNDFNEVLEIPLDRYDDYVESFDPRNDGYAEKLKNFFRAEGKQRFFLDMSGSGRDVERKLNAVMREIPSGRLFSEAGAPVFSPAALIAYCIAAAVFVFFETPFRRIRTKRTKSESFWFGAVCIVPVLFPFILTGPAGFIACGLFVSAFRLLKPLFDEYFRHKKKFRYTSGKIRAGYFAGLFPVHCIALSCILLLYMLCCFLGKIHPAAAVLLPSFFGFSLFSACGAASVLERRLFFPLPIRKTPAVFSLFSPVALIFFTAAVPALLLKPVLPPAEPAGTYGPLPGEAEYAAHAAFQASFSFRSLNEENEYGVYTQGEDGLISGFMPDTPAPAVYPYPREFEELALFYRRVWRK